MSDGNDLVALENAITNGTTRLSALANIPFAPTQIAGFVAQGIFKAIRLGRAIRQVQVQRSETLNARIRARGVLRMPQAADLSDLEFLAFFEAPTVKAAFPLLRQFDAEIALVRRNRLNIAPEVRRQLEVARELAAMLKEDPRLSQGDHKELGDLFHIELAADSPDLPKLVAAHLELFPQTDQSYQEHYQRMQRFWQNQLLIESEALTAAQIQEQESLDEAVQAVVRQAIVDGPDSFVAKSLDLAVTLRKRGLQDEVARLRAQRPKETAAGLAGIDKRLASLDVQIQRLTGV